MAASVYSQEDYCSTRRQSVKTRSLNVNTHVRLRLPSCILVLSSTCFCLPSVSSQPLPLFSTFHCSAFPRGTSDRERGGTDRCTWAVVTLLLHDFFFYLKLATEHEEHCNGETRQTSISIPYTFIPKNQRSSIFIFLLSSQPHIKRHSHSL